MSSSDAYYPDLFFFSGEVFALLNTYFLSLELEICLVKKKMLWMLPCRHISDYDFSIHIVSPEHNKSTSGRTESLLNRLIKHYLLPLLGSAQVPPLVLICCQKEWTAAFWKQVTVKGNEGGRQRTTYSWSLWDRSSMSRQNPTKETNCGQCSERLPFVHWSWILVLTTWR